MPFPLIIPLAILGYAFVRGLSRDSPETASPPREVFDQIALIGPTSAGKSYLGNVLVGEVVFDSSPLHGTTRQCATAWLKNGFEIVDTPGLLDGSPARDIAMDAALESRVVVYVTDGELFEPELQFLVEMGNEMRPRDSHELIIFLSKFDLREKTMPTSERSKLVARLSQQISELQDSTAFSGVEVHELVKGGVGQHAAIIDSVNAAINADR